MASTFDPYAEWLGIKHAVRPLTNYQLLGLATFESQVETIEQHSQQQLDKLAPFRKGEHALQAKRLAFEIESAKICLLNPTIRASYDAGLRASKSQVSGAQPTHPAEATKGKQSVSRPPTPPVPPKTPVAGTSQQTLDPYRKWLGIPPKDQPPNHYRLLGIDLFEADAEIIDATASRQSTHLQQYAIGEHAALSKRLLNEIALARLCLLDAQTKAAYDQQLRQTLDPKANQEPEAEENIYALAQPERRAEPVAFQKKEVSAHETSNTLPQHQFRRKKKQWLIPAVVGGAVLAVIVAGLAFVLALRRTDVQVADIRVDKARDGGEPTKRQSTPPRVEMSPRNAPKPPPPRMATPPLAPKRDRLRILVDTYQSDGAREFLGYVTGKRLVTKDEQWSMINQPLQRQSLARGRILVVTHTNKPKTYGLSECETVARFVQEGGGLLIIGISWVGITYGKYTEEEYPPNQIGRLFGLRMTAYAADVAMLAEHPMTRDLAGLDWRKAGNQSAIQVSEGAVPLIYDPQQKVLCAVNSYGNGRVCMMNWNHAVRAVREQDVEYKRLLQSVLQWLAQLQNAQSAASVKPVSPAMAASEATINAFGPRQIGPKPSLSEQSESPADANGQQPQLPRGHTKPRLGYSGGRTPSFEIELPSGKTITSATVDARDVAHREINTLLQKCRAGSRDVIGFYQEGSDTTIAALATIKNTKLHGPVIVFHSYREYGTPKPKQYVNYENGRWDGVLATWDEQGRQTFWCNYANGQRNGLCCLFNQDALAAVLECTRNKIDAVHLIAANQVAKSLTDADEALADEAAGPVLRHIDEIEKDLKDADRVLRGRLKKAVQSQIGALNSEKRAAFGSRAAGRAAANQEAIQGLRNYGR